jgi:S-adenosylmethionine:tRNA ribosyltransferase-isomerase
MKLSEFDYELPKNLIATHPAEPRDTARLLVMDKISGELWDSSFYDLPEFLKPGDVLVLNESKVIPARLFGEANGRKFEVLLVKSEKNGFWEAWVRPGKKAKLGVLSNFLKN